MLKLAWLLLTLVTKVISVALVRIAALNKYFLLRNLALQMN